MANIYFSRVFASGGSTRNTVDLKALVWSLSTAISVSSSKYILVDIGLHYPFHLHIIQLIATTVLGFIRLLLYKARYPLFALDVGHVTITSIVWPGLTATSSMLALQAVLHFPNLATLAMLPVLALLSEQVWAWLTRPIADRQHNLVYSMLLLGFCCGMLLYNEYRLMVLGLVCAVPAALLAGLARSMYSGSNASKRLPYDNTVYVLSACLYGLVISGCCLLIKEGQAVLVEEASILSISLITLNAISSATALHIGMSMLLPMDAVRDNDSSWALLILSGVVGCVSTSLQQRSFTGLSQILAYGAAILLTSNLGKQGLLWLEDGRAHFRSVRASSEEAIYTVPITGNEVQPTCRTSRPLRWIYDINACTHVLLPPLPAALILLTWSVYMLLNFSDRLHTSYVHPTASLDTTFRSNVSTEIVISMYEEPLDIVTSLITRLHKVPELSDARVHIYTKAPITDIEAIQKDTGAYKVTQLANVGREGGTYLHHIITNWDLLAQHTLFVQAHVHNQREFFPRLQTYFDPKRTGMLSLGFVGHTVKCGGSDPWGWSERPDIISRLYEQVYRSDCGRFLLSYKGQFIVSAARVRGIKKSIYKELESALADQDSWAHQEPYLNGRADRMSAPVFGFTVERIWNMLFQCSDLKVAWKCPTLLSRWREGGSINDCQCIDSIETVD